MFTLFLDTLTNNDTGNADNLHHYRIEGSFRFLVGMSNRSFHCKSLGLGYYPTLSQMFRFSGFLIFKQKNRWKMIFNGSYGKLFPRPFSFFVSTDFSCHSFLKNAWESNVYIKNQGAECHGNDRIQLSQMIGGIISLTISKLKITGEGLVSPH